MDLAAMIIDDLTRQGWSAPTDVLPPALAAALGAEIATRQTEGMLRAAAIGAQEQRQVRQDIRGDSILWLDGSTAAQQEFLARMESLRCALNRELFLGLADFEAHFALYPAGAGYRRHVDNFRGQNLRRVTIVAYLNPDWDAADGGQLRLFRDDDCIATIAPKAGTLACFMSTDFPHEVVPARRPRASIAGWFRVRDPRIAV